MDGWASATARHGSCSACSAGGEGQGGQEIDDIEFAQEEVEALTRSATAAQREARRPISTGISTDRILVLREQLRLVEVELASAHEALRWANKELDDADRAWRRQLRSVHTHARRTRRDRRGELWLQDGDAIDHEEE